MTEEQHNEIASDCANASYAMMIDLMGLFYEGEGEANLAPLINGVIAGILTFMANQGIDPSEASIKRMITKSVDELLPQVLFAGMKPMGRA